MFCFSQHVTFHPKHEGNPFYLDTTCDEGTVHLVGGDDLSMGRVEYCKSGTWHTVCADDWETTGEEAQVVCQTAGFDVSQYGS